MKPDEISKLSDAELEIRITDSRPNQYVPGSIYHAYVAERDKRRHNSLLEVFAERKRKGNARVKRAISSKILKILFARSGNICAFPSCSTEIIDKNSVVTGHVAHIEAENPGGPRYNKNQSDKERFGYDNLILLCPTHHTLVDKDTGNYTVEVLKSFKQARESGTSDVLLDLSFKTLMRTQPLHEYELEIILKNNSRKSISKPKLKITIPNKVIRVTSSRGQKKANGEIAEVYFENLDVDVIHPGEEKKLMQTTNVGIIYFMDSDLHDNPKVMNQEFKVELYADNFEPLRVVKIFKDMQEF